MKRWIEESGKAAADGVMLLSEFGTARTDEEKPSTTCRRMFACKTCDKKFQTFQALGGHRASHKRARARAAGEMSLYAAIISPPKPKRTHECSICGLEFPIGQALGGHMRRHRSPSSGTQSYNKKLKLSHEHDDGEVVSEEETPAAVAPAMKRSSSFSKRVVCLDLNLTPLENDLVKLKMGKPATVMTPIFKCFLQI